MLRGAVTTSNIDTYIWKKKTKINKHPIQEAEKKIKKTNIVIAEEITDKN